MTPSAETAPVALPVLMYHSIGGRLSSALADLSVPASLLAEQLEALQETGHTLMGLTDALVADPARGAVVALTFDDGFADFHAAALPVLDRLGVGATQYVPTAYLGGSSRWLPGPDGALRLMSLGQLREVARSGVEIGAHSHHHVPMDVLPRAEVHDETRRSRELLSDVGDQEVVSFAYPHGYHSRSVRHQVQGAGFANACAIGHRPHPLHGDRYGVQRLMVTPRHTPDDVVRLVEQGRTGLAPVVKRWGGPAWRVARWTAKRAGRTWT